MTERKKRHTHIELNAGLNTELDSELHAAPNANPNAEQLIMQALGIVAEHGFESVATQLASRIHIPIGPATITLHVGAQWRLSAQTNEGTLQLSPSFFHGELDWRRKHSTGKSEPVVKAVWGRQETAPSVFDATAGLAKDAFLLASSGCQVQAMEQHPLLFALIEHALAQLPLSSDAHLQKIQQRLHYTHGDSAAFLANQSAGFVDVIYLDPMFPPRPGSAKVKKDMQLLQHLTEPGLGENLLELSLSKAKQKVIVKRPNYAPPLANKKPSATQPAGLNRFDIYPVQQWAIE